MSQQSNLYILSLYEGDSTAIFTLIPNFTKTLSTSYLDSDGIASFTSEPLFTQQPRTSTPESDFAQQYSIPLTLTCINPDRINEFVLYANMNKEVFVNWWL
jgi:hypothetical protein